MERLFSEFIGEVAFPILVTAFLLMRVEKKLDQLNDTLISVLEMMVQSK
jgi:hypothetical protein